jgi:hypothetical protein
MFVINNKLTINFGIHYFFPQNQRPMVEMEAFNLNQDL